MANVFNIHFRGKGFKLILQDAKFILMKITPFHVSVNLAFACTEKMLNQVSCINNQNI